MGVPPYEDRTRAAKVPVDGGHSILAVSHGGNGRGFAPGPYGPSLITPENANSP